MDELEKCPSCGGIDDMSKQHGDWRCNNCYEPIRDLARFLLEEELIPIPYVDLNLPERQGYGR